MAEMDWQCDIVTAEKAALFAALVWRALAEDWTFEEFRRAAEPFFAAPEGVTFADTNTGGGSD